MNKLDQSALVHLQTIGASCPRLLNALRCSPEAVLGELQVMELACRAFDEACRGGEGKSAAAAKMESLVATLRGQIAKQGLIDDQEFAAFRAEVLAIHRYANTLRDTL